MLVEGTNSQAHSGSSYDVFLSFRGPDTRHGFTDHLYHRMKEAGISVFRDSESLHFGKRIGDELVQAIEQSRIYIPIFSKNYASSRWCLQELARMKKCTNKSNGIKEILPIFLDVEPDDVKLKTNLYNKDLSKHHKKFSTKVESWKKALIEVGGIKGWNWKKDESQVDLMQSVIRTVLTKLNKGVKKDVPEGPQHLVGVDHQAEAIIKKLHEESNSARFLVLPGTGKIGRISADKLISNIYSHFRGCNSILRYQRVIRRSRFGSFAKKTVRAGDYQQESEKEPQKSEFDVIKELNWCPALRKASHDCWARVCPSALSKSSRSPRGFAKTWIQPICLAVHLFIFTARPCLPFSTHLHYRASSFSYKLEEWVTSSPMLVDFWPTRISTFKPYKFLSYRNVGMRFSHGEATYQNLMNFHPKCEGT